MFLVWSPLVNRIFPPVPAPTNSVSRVVGTNVVGGTNLAGTNVLAEVSTNLLGAFTNVAAAGPEENLTLESDLARYHFSSLGGGIKLIEIAPVAIGTKEAVLAVAAVSVGPGGKVALGLECVNGGADPVAGRLHDGFHGCIDRGHSCRPKMANAFF